MKNDILRMCAVVVIRATNFVTKIDVNVSCPCIGYQPQLPKSAYKLKEKNIHEKENKKNN